MSWTIKISNIKARDLVDTGTNSGFTKDQQDPAVHFYLGDVKKRTERKSDAGANADWGSSIELIFNIDEPTYIQKELIVEVFNEGASTMLKQKHVGKSLPGNLLLKKFTLNQLHTDVRADLSHFDKNGSKPQGYVTFNMEITSPAPKVTAAPPTTAPSTKAQVEVVANVDARPDSPSSSESATLTPKTTGKPSLSEEIFQSGLLYIREMHCSEMKSNGAKTSLIISLRNSAYQRETMLTERRATVVTFEHFDFCAEVDLHQISGGMLDVKMKEEKGLISGLLQASKSTAAKCIVCLDPMLSVLGQVQHLTAELCDEKGAKLGHLVLAAVLVSSSAAASKKTALQDGFSDGLIRVEYAAAIDLRHANALLDSTVSNPSLKLAFNGSHALPSEKIESTFKGGVTMAKFRPHFETAVNAGLLSSCPLVIDIIDKNALGQSSLVGTASISLASILINELSEFSAELMAEGKKGKERVGQVTLKALVVPRNILAAGQSHKMHPSFVSGICRIKTIIGKNLHNTELLGMQDPYVRVFYGDQEVGRTAVRDSGGSNVEWQDVNMMFNVAAANFQELKVQAWDDNAGRADALIGACSISMLEAASSLNTLTKLSSILKSNNKDAGEIVIECSVRPIVDTSNLVVSPGFTRGVFCIKKISGMDMVDDNGKPMHEPVITVSLADNTGGLLPSSMKSSTGAGSTYVWPMLDMKMEVTAEDLATKEVTVTVTQKGKIVSTGKIPNLLLSGSQIGREVELDLEVLSGKGSVAGRITLYALTREPEVVVVVDETPSDIDRGELIIQEIRLKGVSSSCKPQIFVQLRDKADSKEATAVAKTASSDHLWTCDYRFPIQGITLSTSFIELTILDHSSMLGSTQLGRGCICLDYFKRAARVGISVDITADIADAKGRQVGTVILASIARKKEFIKRQLPEGFERGVVKIGRIRTVNLADLEGMLGGEQDPFIVIKLDGKEVGRTHVLENKGGSVVFEHLDIRIRDGLTASDLQTKLLTVEGWEENVVANALVGVGTVSLDSLCTYGAEVELPVVKLFNTKGQPAGRIHLYATLEPMPPPKDFVVAFPEGFETGRVCIKRIAGYSIKNTNWMPGNKADPYISLCLPAPGAGAEKVLWEAHTAPVMDAGEHAVWDYLDMEFDCSKSVLEQGLILITAQDKNFNVSDAMIGSGTASLRRACANIDTEVITELSVDLVGKNKKSAGRLVLFVEIKTPPPPVDLTPKAGFTHGKFNINRIRTFDLRSVEFGGSFGGQNDPYCVAKFASWSDKTHSKDNGGSDCLWDYMLMGAEDVPLDLWTSRALEISVFDENTRPLPDTFIGSGTVSMASCITAANLGTEVRLLMMLVGKEGKPAGRLEVYITATEPEAVGSIPDSFEAGVLEVKRLVLMDLAGPVSNPTLKLSLEDGVGEIGQTQDEGAEPLWSMVNWKTPCGRSSVEGHSDLKIEVSSGTMMGRKVFGSATVQLLRAGVKVGQDVQLIGMLEDSKGKVIGKVALSVQLNQDKAQLVEVAVPTSITNAQLNLHSIKINLPQKILTSKKLFTRIEYGSWLEVTDTRPGGCWVDLDQSVWTSGELDRAALQFNRVKVTVVEDSKNSAVIAAGTASLKSMSKLVHSFPGDASYSLKLEMKDDSEVIGTAELSCTLTAPTTELSTKPTYSLEDDFSLEFQEIRASNLSGGDTVGRNDPYIKLSFDTWTVSTSVKEDAGRFAKWTNLDSKTFTIPAVSGLSLTKALLHLVVKDNNLLGGDVVMGEGKGSLVGLGNALHTSQKVIIKLKDPQTKRSAGRVELMMTAVPYIRPAPAMKDAGGGVIVQAAALVVEKTSAPILTQIGQSLGIVSKEPSEMQQTALKEEIERLREMHQQQLAQVTKQLLDMKTDQHSLDTRLGGLVKTLNTTLQSQLDAERIKILNAVTQQTQELARSIDTVSMQVLNRADFSVPVQEPTDEENDLRKKLLSGLELSEISHIKLPHNIGDWRIAHVQAWLAFQVELPEYMESFQKASIDGYMLVKHVDSELLGSALCVDDGLHRKKIVEYIELLRVRQEGVDKEIEQRRKIELKKAEQAEKERQEEEERQEAIEKAKRAKEAKMAAARVAKAEAEKAKETDPDSIEKRKTSDSKAKASKKVPKKKSTKAATFPKPAGVAGQPTPEQNLIDRVRLERAIKVSNADKRRREALAAAADAENNRTWKFEYTGSPKKKTLTDIWGSDSSRKKARVSSLQASMAELTDDVLGSEEFKTQSLRAGAIRPKIKTIARTSVLDEVLAEVKGAMWGLSCRLVALKEKEVQQNLNKDDDLEMDEIAFLPDDTVVQSNERPSSHSRDEQPDEFMANVPEFSYDDEPDFDPPPFQDTDGDGIPDGEDPTPYGDSNEWAPHPPPPLDEEDSYMAVMGGTRRPGKDSSRPSQPRSDKKSSRTKHIGITIGSATTAHVDGRVFDRMSLVYDALVNQVNNDADFIGTNNKLTRLKFYGGLESLLRLRLEWSQFDAMWTKLDSVRSGDLDLKEFKAFFGDLSEFEQKEGTHNLSLSSANPAIATLTKCLYDLCDVVRHAGFTVEEMFSCFDRNGSGDISVSEFCSLLKLIIGKTFDKRLIYQALFVLDNDRSKSVSRDELFLFVYRTWRMQMDELDRKCSLLNENDDTESARIVELTRERQFIVDALKKNFPREIRDYLKSFSATLAGPFATLFKTTAAAANNGAMSPARGMTSGKSSPHAASSQSLNYSQGDKDESATFRRSSSPPKTAGAAGEIYRAKISYESKGRSPSLIEGSRVVKAPLDLFKESAFNTRGAGSSGSQ